ncbi:MAG: AzlC family ABC transporter permease [Anaerolineae bacterium]|nr:AzlC family ABC transporter permease [Anaerolineae bacterium]
MEDSISDTASPARSPWLRGVTRALPIVMGYIPIGFAYGVLAQQAGLSAFNTFAMSLIVYAGSSQLIAVSMFAAGVPALSIILTTFVVNLRHLLFSAAMAPHLKGWRKPELAAFAYELTDESFALHSAGVAGNAKVAPDTPHTFPKSEMLALNVTAQASWVFGSWLGIVAGRLIADTQAFALDYALPAMFIALLVMQTRHRRDVGVAVFAGALAVALTLLGLSHWSVIIATVAGATAATLWEMRGNVRQVDGRR